METERLTWDNFNQETDQLLLSDKGRTSTYTVTKWYDNSGCNQLDISFHLEHFIYVCKEFKDYGCPYDEGDLRDMNTEFIKFEMIEEFLDEKILLEYQYVTGHETKWCSRICFEPDLSKDELLQFCLNLKYKDVYKPEFIEIMFQKYGETERNPNFVLADYHIFIDKQIEIIERVWNEHELLKGLLC